MDNAASTALSASNQYNRLPWYRVVSNPLALWRNGYIERQGESDGLFCKARLTNFVRCKRL